MTEPPTAIDEVHRRVGRNLLRFQEIEVGLRVILPTLIPRCQQNVKGLTLGKLLQIFVDSVEASPGFFNLTFENLLHARNSLVHHFYQLPDVDLLHPEGAAQAVVYLDRQYADIEEWVQFIRIQSLMVLLLRMRADPALSAEYASYHEKLLAQLPPDIEYIDQGDPALTDWQSTRIVKLLQKAEAQGRRPDGMTSLAFAGNYIKSNAPDHTHADYGLRTLKQILLASQMFETTTGTDGTMVMYKSHKAVGV